MSGHGKKSHGSSLNFLSMFRYFVGFTERFFTNLFRNLKWLFNNSQTANNHFDTAFLRHFSNDYLLPVKILIVGILLIFLWQVLVFALVLWTIAKSI
jgi:hypothetical protein